MYEFLRSKGNILQISVITAGFTALIVQVIFLREFLNIFSGNELVAGIVLSCWMLLTAIGSYVGKWFSLKGDLSMKIIRVQIAIAFLPAISIFFIYLMKNLLMPPGTLPGLEITFLFSSLIMMLFCVFSGVLFMLFVTSISQLHYQLKTQVVYGLEAAGSIVGSLLFTFICLRYFSIFQTLIIVASANLTVAVLLQITFEKSRTGMHLIIITLLGWVIINLFFDFDSISKSLVFGHQQIVLNRETSHGNLVVTKTGEQFNFYENGISLFSTDNVAKNEEVVHYALSQIENPENVLIVSGDIAGLWKQVQKYPVRWVDYIEINPAIISAARGIAGFQFPDKLVAYTGDARHFIRHTPNKYDVILLNTPSPGTLGLNRFYTREFYREIKQILMPGGVISFQMEGGANYLGETSKQLYSIVVQTLKSEFKNVIFIPGNANYLLASDSALTSEITKRLQQKGIVNEYVNFYYLDDHELERRGEEMMSRIGENGKINHDFNPVAYFATINYWLSWYGKSLWNIIWPALLLIVIIPVFFKKYTLGMYVAGFTATSLEVIVLLTFQIMFGNFYQSLAMLIAAFMTGLAVGAFLPGWLKISNTKRNFTINQAIIGLLALTFPAIILFQEQMEPADGLTMALLYLFMALSGAVTAVQFAFAVALQKNDVTTTASKIYSADLLGSAGGAVLVSVLIIPMLGLIQTGYLLGGLNLLISLLLLRNRS